MASFHPYKSQNSNKLFIKVYRKPTNKNDLILFYSQRDSPNRRVVTDFRLRNFSFVQFLYSTVDEEQRPPLTTFPGMKLT